MTTGEYIAAAMERAATILAKPLSAIAHEIERVGDNMQVGIVDDDDYADEVLTNQGRERADRITTQRPVVEKSGPRKVTVTVDPAWHPAYLRIWADKCPPAGRLVVRAVADAMEKADSAPVVNVYPPVARAVWP